MWTGAYIYPVAGAVWCLLSIVWLCGTKEDVWAVLDNQIFREYTHYAGTGVSWKLFGIWFGANVCL